MAGRKQVSTEEMRNIVTKMRNANNAMEDKLKSIQKVMANTGNCMNSASGEEIRTNMNNMTGKIEEYKSIIESYASALSLTAEEYESIEAAIKKNAEQFKLA